MTDERDAMPDPPAELWGVVWPDEDGVLRWETDMGSDDDPAVFLERPSVARGWRPALIGVSPGRLEAAEATVATLRARLATAEQAVWLLRSTNRRLNAELKDAEARGYR